MIKCFEGDFNPQLLASFIKDEFGFEQAEYSIFEHPPKETKEGKTFNSIDDIFQESPSKLLELKIKPGQTFDGIPLFLKKILCQKIESLEEYSKQNAEKLFQLASLKPSLWRYPYFALFNEINSKITFKGGMFFFLLQSNQKVDSKESLVTQHLFKILDLRRQQQQLPSSNFLLKYLQVPDDLEVCQDFILARKFANECRLLDQLLLKPNKKVKKKKKQ